MKEKEEAIKIYESLSRPPKEALRPIVGGKLKGKTDINPQWRYKAMTEKFGLVGIGWKYEIQRLWTEPGADKDVLAFAQIAVYIKDGDIWSEPIVGIGGSHIVAIEKGSAVSNDEGYKMAITDAFSTSMKMLGVAADIYAGLWDGSKYNDAPQNDTPSSQKNNQNGQNTQQQPKGGADTPDENRRILDLINRRGEDGKLLFTRGEYNSLGKMRQTMTAQEVIRWLNEQITARTTPKVEPFPEDIPYDTQQSLPIDEQTEEKLDAIF